MKSILRRAFVWMALLGLLVGNMWQGREQLHDWAFAALGHEVDEPLDPDSAQAMRSAISGMKSRIDALEQKRENDGQSKEAELRALREEVALYRSFAENSRSEVEAMQEKVDDANKRTQDAGTAMRNVVQELIKSKSLPEYMTTAF